MTAKDKNKINKINFILLLLVVILIAAPLFYHPLGAKFSGTDDQGPDLIQQEHPNYQVWFQPVWEPPSGEVESFLFALQAAIGAGVVGYVLGYLKGKKQSIPAEEIKSDKVVSS